MADHRIVLRPGTDKVGLSAVQLLASKNLKREQIKCPLCDTPVDIPSNIEEEIWVFAQKLGGEHMPILFTVMHPAEIPVKEKGHLQQRALDPQREAELRETWHKSRSFTDQIKENS